MTNVESLAQKIATNTRKQDENFSIDPFTIAAIISIIVNIVKLWMACRNKKSAQSQLKNPGFIFKFFLKKEINKNFKSLKDRTYIYNSFIDVSQNISETQLVNILKEIEQEKT